MFGILEIAPTTWIEKLQYGGEMLLVGMGTVFVVLATLWGCLELMHFLMEKFNNRSKSSTKAESTSIINQSAIAPTNTTTYQDDDDEIVAVIAAAIAAAQAEHPQLQFRAVAFKRIH